MQPGRFTELFFLDEATAIAAGHRACALCRREDFNRLTEVWRSIHPDQSGADAIDAQLHAERVDARGNRRLHESVPLGRLANGAFVLHHGQPHLVLENALRRWTPSGYMARAQDRGTPR